MKVIIKVNTGETVTLSEYETRLIKESLTEDDKFICESSVLELLNEESDFQVEENNFVYLPSSICALRVEEEELAH